MTKQTKPKRFKKVVTWRDISHLYIGLLCIMPSIPLIYILSLNNKNPFTTLIVLSSICFSIGIVNIMIAFAGRKVRYVEVRE